MAAVRRRLLRCGPPISKSDLAVYFGSDDFLRTSQNNSSKPLLRCFKRAMELVPGPEGPRHDVNSFIRIFTFSDVSSLHFDIDPNFHESVHALASLPGVLTKHGIACHVPMLIVAMIHRCVTDSDSLFVIDFSTKLKPLITPTCYNVLLDSLANTSCLLYGMKRVYTEIVSPSVNTFNIIINAYCRHGYTMESNQYLCKMIQSGLAPNMSTFTSLIMGYTRFKYVDAALRVFHKNMVEYGCAPDLNCYEHLISSICFAKKLGIAQSLFYQMQRQGLAPSWMVFEEILKCCCKLKRYGDAVQVVDLMFTSAYIPELVDCSRIICGLYEQGEDERANAVFHKLLHCGQYYDDEIAWTVLIGGLHNKGLAKEFSQLFQSMRISGCHLSSQTIFMLNQGIQINS